MAISQVQATHTFNQWRLITNQVIGALGDKATLSTTTQVSLVAAINELRSLIGDLTTIGTTATGSVSASSAEIFSQLTTTLSSIGTLSSLTTTQKTSLVAAINEVNSLIGDVGELSSLLTVDKSSAVAAINENTTAISTLSTELIGINSDLMTLPTREDLPITNLEYNHGRFSTEETLDVSTYDYANAIIQPYNSSVMMSGGTYYNDSSTYGGAGSIVNNTVSDLIAKMVTYGARSQSRYGYGFNVSLLTVGSGTTDIFTHAGQNYSPFLSTGTTKLGPYGSVMTFLCWVRLITLSNAATLGLLASRDDKPGELYINGAVQATPTILTVANGWTHVALEVVLDPDFDSTFPRLSANVGDVIALALPSIVPGRVGGYIHGGMI